MKDRNLCCCVVRDHVHVHHDESMSDRLVSYVSAASSCSDYRHSRNRSRRGPRTDPVHRVNWHRRRRTILLARDDCLCFPNRLCQTKIDRGREWSPNRVHESCEMVDGDAANTVASIYAIWPTDRCRFGPRECQAFDVSVS